MAYTLPDLPYPYDALEPHIDAQTMEIHHSKHHNKYVSNVNDALQGLDKFANMDINELMRNIRDVPEDKRQAVINNGGGHANHSLFWQIMGPNGGGEPSGPIADALSQTFGSVDAFKQEFTSAATGRFGSGWAWLCVTPGGELAVGSTANQDSPIMDGNVPVLGLDVWEHAYYLKYQNRRPDYIGAWWNTVNWDKVNELYTQAKG